MTAQRTVKIDFELYRTECSASRINEFEGKWHRRAIHRIGRGIEQLVNSGRTQVGGKFIGSNIGRTGIAWLAVDIGSYFYGYAFRIEVRWNEVQIAVAGVTRI